MTISFFLSILHLTIISFSTFLSVLLFLRRNMDFQNTFFFRENDFFTSTAKQLFFSDSQIIASELFNKIMSQITNAGKRPSSYRQELLNKHNIFSVKTMFSQNFLLWAASFKKRVLKMSQITNAGKKTSKLCKAEQVTLLTVTVRPISNTTVLNIFFFNKRFYSVKYLFLSLTLQAV